MRRQPACPSHALNRPTPPRRGAAHTLFGVNRHWNAAAQVMRTRADGRRAPRRPESRWDGFCEPAAIRARQCERGQSKFALGSRSVLSLRLRRSKDRPRPYRPPAAPLKPAYRNFGIHSYASPGRQDAERQHRAIPLIEIDRAFPV